MARAASQSEQLLEIVGDCAAALSTPSDEEVERMIADFDYDHSGTIDFEEFCGMMLSSPNCTSLASR